MNCTTVLEVGFNMFVNCLNMYRCVWQPVLNEHDDDDDARALAAAAETQL